MKKRKGLSYCVDFNTKEVPGRVVATTVELSTRIFGPDDRMRVDLCDHPLYPRLVAYVQNNPPGKGATQDG